MIQQQILTSELNLIKRLSLSDDVPPALPVRHFRVDSEDDLPPPIPERKSSLDNLIDEGFQRRFTFRPIATVPLPEPLSGIRKIYPSQTPRRNVLQRPPSQPPPPPPPPTSSDSSSPPHPVISFTLYPRPSSQYDYDDDFDDDDFPPPPPLSPSGSKGIKFGEDLYLASVFLDCGGGGGSGRAGGGGGSLESLLQELVLEDFKSIPVFFDEEVGDDVGVCSLTLNQTLNKIVLI
uniref:Uncharacterized protein n=1 Tax=Biomphalaria glabrata TaxID=6526 RepID=A0A2C9L2B6_BIOGL